MRALLVKIVILICALFFSQIKSNAIDSGYSGDKPLFIEITTDWCFACKYLAPTVEELKKEYEGKVVFVRLNLSSEETAYEAEQIAASYGILEFLNNNRNAFPRVAIYCPGSLSPQENLLGSQKKDVYTSILNNILLNSNTICNIGGRPPEPVSNDGRPNEPEEKKIEIASRPNLAEFLERPLGITGSGRPNELQFWTYGTPMPLGVYFYSKALTLPECGGGNEILCYKGGDVNKSQATDTQPIFKPYNPNATRNEKGYNYVN